MTHEMMLEVWTQVVVAVVTAMMARKGFSQLGWEEGTMFAGTRALSRRAGWVSGLAMWPALLLEAVLSPLYFTGAVTVGTVKKQIRKREDSKKMEHRLAMLKQFEGQVRAIKKGVSENQMNIEQLVDAFIRTK